jgi:hypothetical protein
MDGSWKDRMDEEVGRLTVGMTKIAERLSMPELLHPNDENRTSTIPSSPAVGAADRLAPRSVSAASGNDSWNDTPAEDCGPAAVPAAFVSEVTKHSPTARVTGLPRSRPDIISRGILTLDQAQVLFNKYLTKHENYIYSVLEEGSTFSTVRNSSPLLLAAICAVASLHVVSLDIPYEQCYEEFVHLSASHVFSSRNNLDDIRAMCIGAFWLPDISWALVGNGKDLQTLIVQLYSNE